MPNPVTTTAPVRIADDLAAKLRAIAAYRKQTVGEVIEAFRAEIDRLYLEVVLAGVQDGPPVAR